MPDITFDISAHGDPYWAVMCNSCNASRGPKTLAEWADWKPENLVMKAIIAAALLASVALPAGAEEIMAPLDHSAQTVTGHIPFWDMMTPEQKLQKLKDRETLWCPSGYTLEQRDGPTCVRP